MRQIPPIYHVAQKSNLPDILRRGLVPKLGPHARSAPEETSVVYMVQDRDSTLDALMGWLREALEEEIAMLEITFPSSYRGSLFPTLNFEIEI